MNYINKHINDRYREERNNIVLVVISSIYIFWAYLKVISSVVNIQIAFLVIAGTILSLLYLINISKIKISFIDVNWIVYTIILFFSLLNTPYKADGREYLIFFVVMVFLLIYLRSTTKWETSFINLIWIFSGIHSVFIILQFLFKDLVMKLNDLILTDYSYAIIQQSSSNNYFSGITNQAAFAGMFATIFSSLAFCKLITSKKKSVYLILTVLLGFIALLLTQKRSFFVASILAIYFILFIYNDRKTNIRIIRITTTTFLMLIGGGFAMLFIPATQNVFNRLFHEEDLFRSREGMYNTMIEWFQNNKLFGEGIGAAEFTFGYGGHNIYLQVLAETGVVGFVVFYLAFFSLFIFNIKESIIHIKSYPYSRTHGILLFSLYMQLVFILYGVSGNPIYDYTFFLLLIFILAIPSSVIRKQKSIEN